MFNRLKYLSVILGWLLSLAPMQANAEPVAWDGPGKKGWLTRSSEHFQVHYPALNKEYDAIALRALGIAEASHQDLVPFFNTVPVHKTQLVVSDDQDAANGWASYFPFPQIRLYITPPSELTGLQNYGDWLTLLIRHEYVHVLHMEMAKGLPEKGRRIFGRLPILFPHSFTPPMLIEGLAVYLETDYDAGTGRLASTWYQMQMQEEVRSGNFNTLGEAAITSKDWPYGQYYLYGSFFIEYLAQTYGENALKHWLSLYSEEVLPWAMQNNVARRVFGKTFEGLWRDFRTAMYARFDQDTPSALNQISADELHTDESVRLQVTTMGNDGVLYVVEQNDEDHPILNRCEGLICEAITEADQINALDVSAQNELVAVRGVAYASGRYSGDVVLLKEGRWKKLTQGLRVSRVRWLPDSNPSPALAPNAVIALSYKEGTAHLYRVSTGGQTELLWRGSYGEYVGDFSLSPDGTQLVAAYKREGSPWNIATLDISNTDDLSNEPWTLLTDTSSTEASPRFTDNGDIIFVADYTERYNVWQLKDGQSSQLTDVESGVFEPWLSGDRLWVQEYQATGFRMRNLPVSLITSGAASTLNTAQLMPNVRPVTTANNSIESITLSAEKISEAEPYQPWKTLRPYFWVPYYEATDQTTNIGAVTGGSDALGRHYYQIQVSYGTEQEALDANLLYQYQRWAFAYDLSHDLIDINPQAPEYTVIEEHQWRLERRWLWRALDDDFGVHSGAVYRSGAITSIEPGVVLVGDDSFTTASIGLAATLDFQGYLLQSPGGFGSYSHLVVEDYALSSDDVSGLHVQFGWSYLFDLPGRNTLSLALQGGVADKESPRWRLGGLPPQEDGSLFGREQLSLRGYDAGVQFGEYYERQRLGFYTQLAQVNDNWGIWPVGLSDVQVAAYADRGRAWTADNDAEALIGLGLELRFNLLLGYRAAVPLVLGGAHGISGDAGQTQVYARFQLPL